MTSLQVQPVRDLLIKNRKVNYLVILFIDFFLAVNILNYSTVGGEYSNLIILFKKNR